jgi:hypothetical protein
MYRKSQAAMEFLMTYGWALLVILLVLAALAYFGMLNPDRFLPDKITVSDNRIQLISTQSNGLIIKNAGSDTLNNLQINMTNHDCKISSPNTISPGESKRLILICNDPVTPNSRLKGDIKINYSTITYGEIMQKTATAFYGVRGNYFSSKDLVGYWPLDSDTNDYSGNNNHGTNNGATLDTKGGKIGGAYNFNGVSAFIEANDYPFSSTQTISAWFKTSTSGNMPIVSKWNSNEYQIDILNNGGYKIYVDYNAGNCWSYSTINVNDGIWHHIVVVIGNYAPIIYLDGVDRTGTTATVNCVLTDSATKPRIGARTDTWGYFNGQIDEVMIFNRAFSADDVKALYQSGR